MTSSNALKCVVSDYETTYEVAPRKPFNTVKVIIGCEESQAICIAMRELDIEAYSCDILPCSGGHPEWHIQCNVLEILGQQFKIVTQDGIEHWIDKWDLGIFHPPCTRLCVSGARWHKDYPEEVKQAKLFFMELYNCRIEKVAIENPTGIMSTQFRKPNFIARPYLFGEDSTKATCFWTRGLRNLIPTNIIKPTRHTTKKGTSYDAWWFKTCLISDLKERAKARSKTFPGIAKAIAEQWGKKLKEVTAECKEDNHDDGFPPNNKLLGIQPTILWK